MLGDQILSNKDGGLKPTVMDHDIPHFYMGILTPFHCENNIE
jgi:hypothetical protein